ncbi:helix-turn-helix transcriptional regulator [Streptomyces formicae]|uniref:Helix-turn-helix transcriptional regulator n=1 Tax=Streptomyces formicae TaxID=1616117 RepID=A0ABY3WJG3_9ACTN|nr:helix-turn-helix domain-containing protein [Streptomyces formicae]UNM12734.1 helix-turn-helix transcriptional regulator [Streptomyces formicae]
MVSEERKRVLDPERDTAALKALTHPLRIRLLGLLRLEGPGTASEMAVRTGESSASTSYHLRVLAKHGFVAEAEHRDGRERRWRAMHELTSWSNEAMEASDETRAFVSASRSAQLTHLEQTLARYVEDSTAGRLGPEWVEPSGITDVVLQLTPDSLTELWAEFGRKAGELAARDADDPRARQVVLLYAGLPLAGRSTATGQDGAAEEDAR